MKYKVLTGLLSVSVGMTTFTQMPANAQSLSDIHKKQADNKAKQHKKKAQMDHVKGEHNAVLQELKSIEAKYKQTKNEITSKKTEISTTKQKIVQLKKEIMVINKRIQKREALLKERLRSIYENGGTVKYLEVVLGSQSFGDFLDRVFSINTIADSDKQLLKEQKEDKEAVEQDKKHVENQLASLTTKLGELNDLQDKLKGQKEAKSRLSASLKSKEEHIHKDLLSMKEQDEILADQEKAAKAEILRAKREAAEQQRKEAEQAKREAADRHKEKASKPALQAPAEEPSSPNPAPAPKPAPSHGSASFSWPASGSISSPFGNRSFQGPEFHPGIDIANAGSNVPVSAAASGTVIRSYLSSSYGNCVFIASYKNGQMYTTVYAHMSARAVSAGQTVSQGQRIGTMGSTGNSTGQHLHFEIHKGEWNYAKSNAVNPLSYLQ
ncbi:hypothetical protein A374_01959 [Fictibacillus macauensis ZFHKF-1]|uniref:Uncharacterized protein n=1 Tax=Fictibacillus macauensis ZFHKF-1 TaxID=1196324 RepID=I8J5C7_9BACL|nr:M23 family metallopeptidase [Fictibacillus macauensis]EIT86981.1 hypothetical protein A374_01959 [Fictibacillus macauensis ZFHKF-1]